MEGSKDFSLHARIDAFIEDFKKLFPEEMESVFYNGYCYWFAHILATRFKGEIYFNPRLVHFAAMIGGRMYDIYGRVIPGFNPVTGEYDEYKFYAWEWIEWGKYQEENHESCDRIIQSCIKKV